MKVDLKPVVNYDAKAPGTKIVLGEPAIVWALNHPLSPDKPDTAFTSKVIEIGERGVFQTRNSIYVPIELPPDALTAYLSGQVDDLVKFPGEDHGL
jgi:hypothetical protein